MEIKYLNVDIRDFKPDDDHFYLIAHGVNCQNAFGAGFAGAIAEMWPEVKRRYHAYPKKSLRSVLSVVVSDNVIVANCFTQRDYGRDGKVYADKNAIYTCLRKCFDHAQNEIRKRPVSILMPKIGTGFGGLDWEEDVLPIVESLIEKYEHSNIKLYIIDNK